MAFVIWVFIIPLTPFKFWCSITNDYQQNIRSDIFLPLDFTFNTTTSIATTMAHNRYANSLAIPLYKLCLNISSQNCHLQSGIPSPDTFKSTTVCSISSLPRLMGVGGCYQRRPPGRKEYCGTLYTGGNCYGPYGVHWSLLPRTTWLVQSPIHW